MKKDNTELFERMPVPRAVLTLVIPTIISQVITVIYNIADTFFIGQMGDPNQVAAATLVMPPFIVMTGMANLFGIGGSSLIARSLGRGEREKARSTAAFCIWSCIGVAVAYGLFILWFRPTLYPLLGSDENTYDFCTQYALWAVTVGAVPTILSACLAHLVRAEGYARQASLGLAMGGILNVLLDPLFIFPMGLGIKGAAIATMLSNVASVIYFAALLYRNRDKTVITFDPRYYTVRDRIPREVMLVGLPTMVMFIMGMLSNMVLNKLAVGYSNQAVAGVGIAKKLDMFAIAFANGMTQGCLPLIGYNYAAKNFPRMKKAIQCAFLFGVIIGILGTVMIYTCAVPVSRFFIDDAQTVAYGQYFLRIICVICPGTAASMMCITIMQSVGEKTVPMLLSILRKGGMDIPFMLILNSLWGLNAIMWAIPLSEYLAMVIGLCFFIPFWKRVRREMAPAEGPTT